jgi:hypothetical protein
MTVCLAGCLPTFEPSQGSVLAGEWVLAESQEFEPAELKLVFDRSGNLDKVQAQVAAKMATYSRFDAYTDVTGDAVSIEAPFYDNWFVFDGTLSPDQNRIEGVASLTLSIDRGETVEVLDRPATLIRVGYEDESPDGSGADGSSGTPSGGSPPDASGDTAI